MKRKSRTIATKDQNIPIVIVGEGITEYFYFKHLKIFCPTFKHYHLSPRYFLNNSGYKRLGKDIKDALDKFGNNARIIVVFDLDVAENDNGAKKNLNRLLSTYSKRENICFCPSLPSIEYWFLLHFEDNHSIMTALQVESKLKNYIQDYCKTEKFLEKDKWIKTLMQLDNLKMAIHRAKEKTNNSYTEIYKAINILQEK